VRAFAFVWRLGYGVSVPSCRMGPNPDTFVRANGIAATRTLLEQAVPLADFFMQRLAPGPRCYRAAACSRSGENRRGDQWRQRSGAVQPAAKKAAQLLDVDEDVLRQIRSQPAASAREQRSETESERQRTITTKRR